MADERRPRVKLALAVALAAGFGLAAMLVSDWRHVTCEEWQEKEREFMASGDSAPLGDHFGDGPEFTQEDWERAFEGTRELLATQPKGCEPE